MAPMQEALKEVRDLLPCDYITKGYDLKDKYVFETVSENYQEMFTDQSHYVIYNKTNGNITMDNMMYLAYLKSIGEISDAELDNYKNIDVLGGHKS